MYVNQIDDFIDKTLDKLHFDPAFIRLVSHKWINYVEHQSTINSFIQSFFDSLDKSLIDKITNSPRNIEHIRDIIKRYLAYYVFLTLAYYYPGTNKEFSNNLIQYSRLQERSNVIIRNFFDTANNYSVIKYYKLIKDVSRLIMMTEIEVAAIDKIAYASAFEFIEDLGQDYVDNYLLQIKDGVVSVNEHNLIKTIVFKLIYQNQDRTRVFEILAETEEENLEYTYIDIVVTDASVIDVNSLSKLFTGKAYASAMAHILIDLLTQDEPVLPSIDANNNNLLALPIVMPIVDNFLRYHQESYKTEAETNRSALPLFENNAQNVRELLLQQKRDKNSDTLAQIIINNVDIVSEYYSPAVQNNPDAKSKIDKLFKNIFQTRKAVIHNYEEEVAVVHKLKSHGKFTDEMRESFLEMNEILNNAYFNFRDFSGYGTKIILELERSISVLRYANIEFPSDNEFLDVHSVLPEKTINLVGLAIPPITNLPVMCHRRRDLVNIREFGENGFESFLNLMKLLWIDTIEFNGKSLWHNHRNLKDPRYSKVIYWIYDPSKDTYDLDHYENSKAFDNQDSIKLMNSILYTRLDQMLRERLHTLVAKNKNIRFQQMLSLLHQYVHRNRLSNVQIDKYLDQYQRSKTLTKTPPIEITRESPPIYRPIKQTPKPYAEIDFVDPTNPQPFVVFKEKTDADGARSVRCGHEVEWNRIYRLKNTDINAFNNSMSLFVDKYVTKTTMLDFNCKLCGMMLPVEQYVKDAVYDNETETLQSQYIPDTTPLQEIDGYQNYAVLIQRLDHMINNRISLITGTNLFQGKDTSKLVYRKILVKNIIDIVLLHNKINMAKNTPQNVRAEYFRKNFGVNPNRDEIYFFDLQNEFDEEKGADRLQFHNVLLYLMLCYMIELTGSQIIGMEYDRESSIFYWLRYGPRFFEGLRIRTNKTDTETVPITNYPVLCYLIYSFGYLFYKSRLWYVPDVVPNKINVAVMSHQIHSMVDLINSIIMDASRHDNYVYNLISSKIFSHMNKEFSDLSIIELLKQRQSKYDNRPDAIAKKEERYLVDIVMSPAVLSARHIPSTFAAPFTYRDYSQSMYVITDDFTDYTICPNGEFRRFRPINCPDKPTGENRFDVYFDRIMLKTAKTRRCLSGKLHDFHQGKCNNCGREIDAAYTKADIDELITNMMTMEEKSAKADYGKAQALDQHIQEKDSRDAKLLETIKPKTVSENIASIVSQFSSVLDPAADLGYSVPFFLDKTVYIIDHKYTGSKIDPIYLDSEKVIFQANQPHYKTDVYYYTDNKADVTVYYDAISKLMLGYKPKHKDYVNNDQGGHYLKINPGVKDKLALMAWPTQFLTIEDQAASSLDGLMRNHILSLKRAIDTFCYVLSQTKNDKHAIDSISAKYRILDFKETKHLAEWGKIRDLFVYEPVTMDSIPEYIDAHVLNRLDKTGAAMYTWLHSMIHALLEANKARKPILVELFIAIINQIYEENNTDSYNNSFDLRRFYYDMYGTNMERFGRMSYEEEEDDDEESLTPEGQVQLYDDQQMAEAVDVEAYGEEDEWMGSSDS